MSEPQGNCTRRIETEDPTCGFRCGRHALDDFFERHALSNDRGGVGLTYVLPADPEELSAGLPAVLGFYTLSMAAVRSSEISEAVRRRLPRYPMPVALIGRLAIDERGQGRRLGELLLIDALRRIAAASAIIGCLGAIVDAKDEGAESFYAKYDFVTVDPSADWPRRMFLALETIRKALEPT